MPQYTVTFTDDTTRTVQAGSVGFGDGRLEFFADWIPVGDPIVTVPIVDADGQPILASLSPMT